MLNGYIIASILAAIAILILSLLVFFRNTKAATNRSFLVFSLLGAAWIIANYLGGSSDVPYRLALSANRLTFLFAISSTLALYIFVEKLTKLPKFRLYLLFLALNGTIGALTVTPLIVENVYKKSGTYSIKFNTLAYLFFITLLINIVLSVRLLLAARSDKDPVYRSQITVILLSFGIFLAAVLTTNALVPLLFNYYGLTDAGALSIYILIGGAAYAITKHRLFDIKFIVARSLTYIFSLVFVSAIFGFIAIALIKVFFHPQLSVVAEIALAISTALAALSFQRVKKVFDKFSNRVFYRDSYNVQTFLDAFNRVLVSTYELAPLLRRISILIEDNLKPAYCLFGINGYEKNAASWTQPSTKVPLSEEEIKFIQDFVTRTKTKLIIADLIEDKYSDFQKYLQKRDIAVFAKLATSNREGDIGYFMLGSKKSGNMYTSQDIDVLEIVINELVVAIQNALHTEEIEQFNITLQDKIKDATYRLRSTNEKLRALDEAKDDFVSMASHQLRTPLTSVKGNLSLVLDGDAGKISSLQRQMLQQAYGSSQRMVYLIADLLNVSRLKTGKFVIEPSVVNLASVVEDEVNQLMETAKSRNLNLKFIKETKIDNLMLDETKTRQVIMNFIDNAIYYTPSGGEIDVYVKETQSAIECRVVDNGIGVPKNEVHHLFTKFYRAKNARKARPDGTGLGLFMAKKVIVSEGGALIFDSEEGKGSTFGFSFPKSKLAVSNTNAPTTAPEPAAATQNA